MAQPRAQGAASELAQAKRLATGLRKAHSQAARERALTAVMRALGVGVVSASGRPIVVAVAKGAASRAQLYDFELRTLAASLGRRQEKSYTEVAAGLSSVGFTLSAAQGLPAELLHKAVAGAVRAGHRRGAHGYLLVLLVQRLGQLRGDDPAASTQTSKVRLDPLQAWLISADFAIGALRKLPAPHRAQLTRAYAASSLSNVCQKYRDAEEAAKKERERTNGKTKAFLTDKVDGKITDFVKDTLVKEGAKHMPGWVIKGGSFAGKSANIASQLLKVIHGSLLALSVSVTTPDAALPEVHWGHEGPGGTLEFQEKVEMLDDYGDLVVKCGALVGLELPPKGPIKDVDVSWDQAQGDINAEGVLDCPPPAIPLIGNLLAKYICMTKTGEDGIARLRLETNIEKEPGRRSPTVNTGLMSGVALYQSASGGGITGWIGQFLFPKDGGGTRWFVSSHQCGGFIAPTASAGVRRARAGQAGPTCSATQVLSGTINYTHVLTHTFSGPTTKTVMHQTEQISLSLRLTYDDYDEATATFWGTEDAGSTMTASFETSSDGEANDGCSYIRSSERGSYSGPASPGVDPGWADRTLRVPIVWVSAPTDASSDGRTGFPEECPAPETASWQGTHTFSIPPVAQAQIPPGAHSATFDWSDSTSDPITVSTDSITGTLTWDQPAK